MKTLVIVVGKPICNLESLGVTEEDTVVFEKEEQFLPRILVKHGVFKSTSVVRRHNEARLKNSIPLDKFQNLWRSVGENGELEMTRFKIGRTVFWIIVGELDEDNS